MVSPCILSLLLISQLIELKAQTGAGCFLKTCLDPNKVRIDAIFDTNGDFIGGCSCACHPDLYIPTSSTYCSPPKEVNFDPLTLIGDCSCKCPSSSQQSSCRPPSIWDTNTCECRQIVCSGHQVIHPQTGHCICPKIAPNGQFYPLCNLPVQQDPITCDCVPIVTTPPNPQIPATPSTPIAPPRTITCGITHSCSCPAGTGDCTINCKGNADSCKDAVIQCNNNGYDCIVNCVADSACSGDTIINGPVGGSLTVHCLGLKACLGAVQFNGQHGTDLTVYCDGGESCKGSDVQFNFGTGLGTIECYGAPDSCQAVEIFNLPNNIYNIAGAGFQCNGRFCPATAPEPFFITASPTRSPTPAPTFNPTTDPTNNPTSAPSPAPTNNPSLSPSPAPTIQPTFSTNNPTAAPTHNPTPAPTDIPTASPSNPTNNPTVAPTDSTYSPTQSPTRELIICTNPGSCHCPPGIGNCVMYCESSAEACKDGTIQCNGNGYHCIVNCISESSCSGSTIIIAPFGGALTVNCMGQKSCGGSVYFNAEMGTDLTVHCEGGESCKGHTIFNFGIGKGVVACSGFPDSCQGAVFHHNPRQISVQCVGSQCPSTL